ncbi:MAG: BRO-N domain-containing protein [Patescibacteria group bacterium]
MWKETKKQIVFFEEKEVRRLWHNEQWYFAIIDVVQVLTDSNDAKQYIKKMRSRDLELSNNWGTICTLLPITSRDGKRHEENMAKLEGVFRIIQSITSPYAEPFKLWLAKVGQERIKEINDPEIALNRSRELWEKHGRSKQWIQQRMMGQEMRNKLTDYWNGHDVKRGDEFAILTNIIHEEWSNLSVKGHKALKNLTPAHNLRDHMNEAELVLTTLAEMATRQIAESVKAKGFEENKIPAKKGGQVAKNARQELESETGKSVISNKNFLSAPKRIKKLS